jgi:alkanesulfonate monooxygenase SsuD/methylene tetrahydromethanopterin reductase-like flavin-dependent oxidoreductase (luciferase family)
MMEALAAYRRGFRPSEFLSEPYAMLGINVIAADTDVEAQHLFTSLMQAFLNLRRGEPKPLPPPVDGFEAQLTPAERALIEHMLASRVVGSPDTVRKGLEAFIAKTAADELIVTSQIYDHAARLRSFEITASVMEMAERLHTIQAHP